MPISGYNSPINTNLPLSVDEAPKEIRGYLQGIYNALQQLQIAFNTYTGAGQPVADLWSVITPEDTVIVGNMNRLFGLASETISFGAAVNIYNNVGVLTLRNANATNNTKPCHAWCSTTGGIANGSYGEVQIGSSLCTGIGGLTIGTRYFLSTTNGLITATSPVAVGNIGQVVGYAVGGTRLVFNPNQQWTQY